MSCDLLEYIEPDARFQGTVSLLFAEGDFSICTPNSTPTEFESLKTITGFNMSQSPEYQERYKYNCGRKDLYDKVVKDNGIELKANLTDLTKSVLKKLLRGKDETTITQSALIAQAIDNIDFTTTPSDTEKLYFLADSASGTPANLYNITAIAVEDTTATAVLEEGVDYVVRKSMGAIKFLTPQTGLLSVTVTADASSIVPLSIGSDAPKKGWLRVLYTPTVDTIGDQCEPEMVIDAIGTITFEGDVGISTEDAAEPEITFAVTGNPKLTDLRKFN